MAQKGAHVDRSDLKQYGKHSTLPDQILLSSFHINVGSKELWECIIRSVGSLIMDFGFNDFFTLSNETRTRRHGYKLLKPLNNNNARSFSFSCRSVDC
jgi:hypothetical protein